MTRLIPPSSLILLGTIRTVRIVVTVKRRKLHSLVIRQRIVSRSAITSKLVQCIFISFTTQLKLGIACVLVVSQKVLQLHHQLVRATFRNLVNRFQSQPKLLPNHAESVPIVGPTAVKVDRSVESLLDYEPTSAEALQLAEHGDWG